MNHGSDKREGTRSVPLRLNAKKHYLCMIICFDARKVFPCLSIPLARTIYIPFAASEPVLLRLFHNREDTPFKEATVFPNTSKISTIIVLAFVTSMVTVPKAGF